MRRLIFALLALLPTALLAATPTFVASFNQDDINTSINTAIGTISSGQGLLGCLRVGNASDVVTAVTDNVNGAWTLADKIALTGTNWLYVYYRLNAGAGATTVAVDFSTSTSMRAAFHVISISAHASGYDGAAKATGTGTAVNSGTRTTTVANDYIFACVGIAAAEAITWTAPLTNRENASDRARTADRGVTATGAYAALGTLDSSQQWGAIVAAFGDQAPPVGGSTVVNPISGRGGAAAQPIVGLLLQRRVTGQ